DIEQIELANTQVLAAMQKNENYSVMLTLNETREHWYFTRLPYSNWYLTTRMPFGTLDRAVNMLTRSTLYAALFGCLILLVGLLILFIFFNNMTKTQLLALNRARKEAERANKAKSEFLSSMSHDIRTPMNAIVGMTAIAAANIDNRMQLENCLNKITLSSKHLLGLINDVLDMSKIESGKLTMNIDQVSLREVMDSIVSIVQPQVHAKNQTFNVSIHDIDTENVCCDGVRLNQVLINLLSNAIKFTPEKGTISLALHEEASPKGENFVRINLEVKDTGYGMSPEFTERIFDSFSRENTDRVHKTEGTGLGMAITKYIIDTMGGTISLESKQGVGTTFYVTLDLEKASIQETDMKLPNWHMLLVDDDPMLCKSVIAALKDIGVQAESVLDGESAIKLVKKRHDENNDFQIILLDWKLPGINGIDAAKEIRRQTVEEIPSLLISAYDWTDIEEDARTAGINGFICKPLFKSTLYYGLRPYANDPDDKKQTKLKKTTRDFTGKKILLAEDNDLNWEIAETLLSEEGLELDWAENGQVCVEVFQQSDVGYYDAILMDIRMPVMNGYDAAKTIRSLERPDAAEIPIIAMTADAFAEDIQRCLDVGMNAHIAKPIDVHDVLVQLDKYMKP
ncbi:MAG: response regulator, partial [Firmicutes bacterium]|nr:response regulator [Bacillota bacterium]